MHHQLCRVVVCLLVACGGGSAKTTATPPPLPPSDPIPKTAAPGCQVVADQLAIVVLADHTPDQRAAAVDKTTTDLRTQCEGGWSDEARSCFGSAQAESELEGCTQLLTEPQRKAFAAPGGADTAQSPPKADAPQGFSSKKPTTRGPTRKDKDKPKKTESDPDDGGE